MFPTTFQDMGIPIGYAFKQLLFSPIANILVLQTCAAEDNWRPERLYFRQTVWDKYRLVGSPGDLVSQESPFVHPSKPLLAYNSLQHEFSLDAEGQATFWRLAFPSDIQLRKWLGESFIYI